MNSLYLSRLKPSEYEALRQNLWNTQAQSCFICDEAIDLQIHGDSLDVDHIVPLASGGKDDTTNFALAHAHCNRSKQASDLRIARLLVRFQRLQLEAGAQPGRPNLGDVLRTSGFPGWDLAIRLDGTSVKYSFPDLGRQEIVTAPLLKDPKSEMDYFFALLPVHYLAHDERINPRAIASESLRKLLEEFNAGLPQLHVSLAWLTLREGTSRTPVRVFDGQHKAAAQILLGTTELPLRVFVNPDLDKLLTASTHAGTSLRQVAFDKAVQRRFGSRLYGDRIEQYLSDLGRPAEYRGFSEKDLVDHFKGRWREVRSYVLDDVRDAVTHDKDNRLMAFVDFGGRSGDRPLSYSSIEKTFYSFFIHPEVLTTPLDFGLDRGENPRELEKEQLIRLMNIVAKCVYEGQFQPAIGTSKLENRVQSGQEAIPHGHLRAVRMGKEEILHAWLVLVRDVIHFALNIQPGGTLVQPSRLFHSALPEGVWESVRRAVERIAGLPLWMNLQLSSTVFGGKQNYDYWRVVFATGRTPAGQPVLVEPITLPKLMA